MTEQEQETLYDKADKLSHDGLTKFLKNNNMDEDKYLAHRIRLIAQRPVPKITRADRAKMLKKQNGRCGFCRDPIPYGVVGCYSKDHKDVVCQRCNLALGSIRALMLAGIPWSAIQKRLDLSVPKPPDRVDRKCGWVNKSGGNGDV